MIKLIGNAKLERIRGTDTWRLVEDFIVFLTDGRKILIPHGFITDKASVPLGLLIKRDDKYIIDGALVHDYLYATQKIQGKWITRKQADQILLAICKHVGMSKDELLRMKQVTGLASLFANKDFSDSWEAGSN